MLSRPNHIPDTSLFSTQGERKYLNQSECKRFLAALPVLKDPSEQTFCETIYWTGCRISEALQLDVMRVNIEEGFLVFRTLKKHGAKKGKEFRSVPIPDHLAERLDSVHYIIKTQRTKTADQFRLLWQFGRQKAWKLIRKVMEAAEIFGIRACARGLRHSFGVDNVMSTTPETKLQKWLGHSDLKTTAIYLNVIGKEDRIIAERFWDYRRK